MAFLFREKDEFFFVKKKNIFFLVISNIEVVINYENRFKMLILIKT